MRMRLKGIAKTKSRGHTYYYAWRGGPRLVGEPGTPEFVASYNAAVETRRAPDASKFRSVVTAYKSSTDYTRLAASTKKNWAVWLDRISDHFGDLSTKQFDRPDKIRPVIRRWRSKWEHQPRTADYAIQVLSAVLSHAVDPLGKIASNPCEGIRRLYDVNRSDIIWTADDIASFKAAVTTQGNVVCSAELALAVDLAAHTGLRLGDLIRLSWSHVGDNEIALPTSKSGGGLAALIPLYDDLRAVLDRAPKRATTILTSARNQPWTQSGLSSAVQRVKVGAKWDRDLHFHDLRGTAATRFYIAGLGIRVIAEIMAWEENTIEKIIRRYVGRQAATKDAIRRLGKNQI